MGWGVDQLPGRRALGGRCSGRCSNTEKHKIKYFYYKILKNNICRKWFEE
jgi:hypothetical protein